MLITRLCVRFARLFAGAFDCPSCGAWCSPKDRRRQRLPDFRVWTCPKCQSLLTKSTLGAFCKMLAVLFFIAFSVMTIGVFIVNWTSSNLAGSTMLVTIAVFQLIVGLLCLAFAPFVLTITGQPGARAEFQHGVCRKCRYDLRAGCHARCPECGTACLDVVQAWRRSAIRDAAPV